MGVDLIWRRDDGSVESAVYDSEDILAHVLGELGESRANRNSLIATIDPYGRRSFVPQQGAQLIKELEAVRNEMTSAVERTHISYVISVLRSAASIDSGRLDFEGD